VAKLKEYYNLTKPGIIYGNLITAIGGFLLASKDHVDISLLIFTLLGTSLIIGSACVFNNYIDRGIDVKMDRTKKRALVSGVIKPFQALVFGSIIGLVGVLILIFHTNGLVVSIGISAFIIYVVFYGLSKRHSVHGTLVGSLAGAAPIVAGYCAVTDDFNSGAIILLLILIAWQMAHFYAIATYRLDDYKAAGIPVLPIVAGIEKTKKQIVTYVVAFIIATLCLTFFGYTGVVFTVVMLALGLWWLYRGAKGFGAKDSKKWARRMFLISLIIITGLSLMLSINTLIS
jgi:protoheme IX farnesyltransferase